MSQRILVTGAAGGVQGSTGRLVTESLIQRGFSVRALVHKLDARSDRLRSLGAEVIEGNLLDPASTRAALQGINRAYFTYPVADGLLEATTVFAQAAREAGTERLINLSQLQNTPEVPSFRNFQHRLSDQIFNWAEVGAVHLHAPPFYENVRAMTAKTIAEQDAIFLPWGKGDAIFRLVGAEDVARVPPARSDRPSRFPRPPAPSSIRASDQRSDGLVRRTQLPDQLTANVAGCAGYQNHLTPSQVPRSRSGQ